MLHSFGSQRVRQHWETELNLRRGDSTGASLVAQRLKCLPAMWETWVRSLGQEDPLEKEMATHSSILAWRIPWREEHGRLQSMELQRVGHDFTFTFTFSHWSAQAFTVRGWTSEPGTGLVLSDCRLFCSWFTEWSVLMTVLSSEYTYYYKLLTSSEKHGNVDPGMTG